MNLKTLSPLNYSFNNNATKIVIFFLIVFLSQQSFTQIQDKRYTQDSENGYMWIDFEKRMIAKNVKYDFLSSMLENQKLKNLTGSYKDDLGCDSDVKYLQSTKNDEIDLNTIISIIDKFYSDEINRIIPIRYAYCYCIKELAGYNIKDLQAYAKKLIIFSSSELKK
ncbi:MAG: hypothetical protein ABI638_10900 [Ignavibacteriota bacterium]